jgi:hypothetical protein
MGRDRLILLMAVLGASACAFMLYCGLLLLMSRALSDSKAVNGPRCGLYSIERVTGSSFQQAPVMFLQIVVVSPTLGPKYNLI